MADQYGKKMKEGSSRIEGSNGISKIVYIFQWFAEKIRKGSWHWKWRISFFLLLVFSNLLWRFVEGFHAEFSSAAGDLQQLFISAAAEGSIPLWRVPLSTKLACWIALRKTKIPFASSPQAGWSLDLEENVGKFWMMWANGNMFKFHFSGRVLENVRFPNSGQNPGKNQQDVGEFCWSFYWVLNGGHGSRLKDRSCPKNDQLPHGMATFIEKLFESCHWTWVKPWFRKGFPSHTFLCCNFQIKRWESSSTLGNVLSEMDPFIVMELNGW